MGEQEDRARSAQVKAQALADPVAAEPLALTLADEAAAAGRNELWKGAAEALALVGTEVTVERMITLLERERGFMEKGLARCKSPCVGPKVAAALALWSKDPAKWGPTNSSMAILARKREPSGLPLILSVAASHRPGTEGADSTTFRCAVQALAAYSDEPARAVVREVLAMPLGELADNDRFEKLVQAILERADPELAFDVLSPMCTADAVPRKRRRIAFDLQAAGEAGRVLSPRWLDVAMRWVESGESELHSYPTNVIAVVAHPGKLDRIVKLRSRGPLPWKVLRALGPLGADAQPLLLEAIASPDAQAIGAAGGALRHHGAELRARGIDAMVGAFERARTALAVHSLCDGLREVDDAATIPLIKTVLKALKKRKAADFDGTGQKADSVSDVERLLEHLERDRSAAT